MTVRDGRTIGEKISDLLWSIWIPDYEGGGPWWRNWQAQFMWHVRRVWYWGKKVPCSCPGCDEYVFAASASGMCGSCLNEDCQHEDCSYDKPRQGI